MTTVVTSGYPASNISIENFLLNVVHQLNLQGQEPVDEFIGGHPDPVIRSCYRAASRIIDSRFASKYIDMITAVYIHRPGLVDTHFVNLWFRSLQFVFRNRRDLSYLQYTEDGWFEYFISCGLADIKSVKALLLSRNTATHVLSRYRSLAAAVRLLHQANPAYSLKVADIGCSLGLGLKASLEPCYLVSSEMVDKTPGCIVQTALPDPCPPCTLALGVDIDLPSVGWVKACNYPQKYEIDGEAIDRAVSDLGRLSFPVKLIEADVLNPKIIKKLTPQGRKLNLVYSSMSLYEMSPSEQKLVLSHFAAALEEGGLHIDLTLRDPKNWFLGARTTVRQKKQGILTPPLEWLLWKDTRCNEVSPGADFDEVMKIYTA